MSSYEIMRWKREILFIDNWIEIIFLVTIFLSDHDLDFLVVAEELPPVALPPEALSPHSVSQ